MQLAELRQGQRERKKRRRREMLMAPWALLRGLIR